MKKTVMLSFLSCFIILTWANLAFATQVTINITATNPYTLYYSSDITNVGATYVGYDADAFTAETYVLDLDLSTQWYLNVVVVAPDFGECLLADVDVDGIGQFLTDDSGSNWQVSTSGFGTNLTTPTSYGTDGSPPFTYSSFASIDDSAHYIWTNSPNDTTAYFTAALPTAAPAVPEPGTLLLLGSGLIGLVRFRKKS